MRTPREKMRDLLDLVDFAEQVFRQNVRRRHPEWSEVQVEAEVRAWHGKQSEGDVERWYRLGAEC